MASNETPTRVSIECEKDVDGSPGVVVYGNKTYPISSQQDALERTASDDGQGPYSSVQPFQFPHYENEDTAMDRDLPETDSNSPASLQEEEDEEDDWGQLPSDVNLNDMANSNLCI